MFQAVVEKVGIGVKRVYQYAVAIEYDQNSNPVRLHNRCIVTGRARGYYRKFGISILTFRKLALEGKIPGVRKASW